MTGNLPVRSVDILCCGLMISEKTWLEHVYNVSIGPSSVVGLSGVLVDLMLFQVFSMCSCDMAMEGGR